MVRRLIKCFRTHNRMHLLPLRLNLLFAQGLRRAGAGGVRPSGFLLGRWWGAETLADAAFAPRVGNSQRCAPRKSPAAHSGPSPGQVASLIDRIISSPPCHQDVGTVIVPEVNDGPGLTQRVLPTQDSNPSVPVTLESPGPLPGGHQNPFY